MEEEEEKTSKKKILKKIDKYIFYNNLVNIN